VDSIVRGIFYFACIIQQFRFLADQVWVGKTRVSYFESIYENFFSQIFRISLFEKLYFNIPQLNVSRYWVSAVFILTINLFFLLTYYNTLDFYVVNFFILIVNLNTVPKAISVMCHYIFYSLLVMFIIMLNYNNLVLLKYTISM